ncbi:MAG: hypothetical protein HQL50_08770 [Magnetococcales bacterium]|nr:hypothetical protein [Magnetococcales bacterium]
MVCSQCGHRYSTEVKGIGGSASPGILWIVSWGIFMIGYSLPRFDAGDWSWVVMAVSGFFLILCFVARSTAAEQRGRCPACDTPNTVYPWSL